MHSVRLEHKSWPGKQRTVNFSRRLYSATKAQLKEYIYIYIYIKEYIYINATLEMLQRPSACPCTYN